MVSLIISRGGWMSLCDKSLNIRWGSVDGMGRFYRVYEVEGIVAAYNKKASDRRAGDPEWHDYVDLAYSPILEWSE